MTSAIPNETLDGLSFIGTESNLDGSHGAKELGESLQSELDRIGKRLEAAGRSLTSCLSLDVFYDESLATATDIECQLSERLGAAACPDVLLVPVPVRPGDSRRVIVQAISSSKPIEGSSLGKHADPAGSNGPDDAKAIPLSNRTVSGDVVLLSGHGRLEQGGIVDQSHRLMAELDAGLRACGATFADAVKFNIYYVGAGTMEDWATAARVRATYFDEPGPVATGIPVPRLARPGELIAMQLLAVRRRDVGIEASYSWPEGHWDWPFHLPYRHGCRMGKTAFVGGQVSLTSSADVIDPSELGAQAVRSLQNVRDVLAPLGLTSGDLLRVTAFFCETKKGDRSLVASVLRDEVGQEVEVSLISLPVLAYENMVIEIEAEARA